MPAFCISNVGYFMKEMEQGLTQALSNSRNDNLGISSVENRQYRLQGSICKSLDHFKDLLHLIYCFYNILFLLKSNDVDGKNTNELPE